MSTDGRLEIQQDNRFGIVPREVAYSAVSVTAKAVYMVLSQFNEAFPSRRFIGEKLGVSLSTVRRALSELSEAGLLVIEHRFDENGGQRSSLYRLGSMSYIPPRVPSDPPPRVKVDPPPRVTPDSPPQVTGDPHKETTKEGNNVEERSTDVDLYAHANFDDFWMVYPRKAGKAEARKAWAKAVKRALPDDILNGARRYRDDPNREGAFTAHPSTWLNQDRWEDDPLPSRIVGGTRKMTRTEQNLDLYNRLYGGQQNEPRRSIEALDLGLGTGWPSAG